jgi:hypothetical protein
MHIESHQNTHTRACMSPSPPASQVKGRWCPPWNVLAGAALLAVSLLHYLSRPTGAAWLDHLQYVALGSVALCLPRIALRAALALRRGVSSPPCAARVWVWRPLGGGDAERGPRMLAPWGGTGGAWSLCSQR